MWVNVYYHFKWQQKNTQVLFIYKNKFSNSIQNWINIKNHFKISLILCAIFCCNENHSKDFKMKCVFLQLNLFYRIGSRFLSPLLRKAGLFCIWFISAWPWNVLPLPTIKHSILQSTNVQIKKFLQYFSRANPIPEIFSQGSIHIRHFCTQYCYKKILR